MLLQTLHIYLLHSPTSPPLSLVQQFGMISIVETSIGVRGYYETCFMNLIYYFACMQKLQKSFSINGGVGKLISHATSCRAVGFHAR